MNAPLEAGVASSWSERNQRWLAAQLSALHALVAARLDAGVPAPGVAVAFDDSAGDDRFVPALQRCAQRFGLTPFERDLLLLAAGFEIDRELRELRDQRLGGVLSFSTALGLLDAPHWSALGPAAPLRHWQLLQLGAGALPPHAPLAIDERVLHFITGVAALDSRLQGLVQFADRAPEADAAAAASLAALLARAGPPSPLLLATGEAGAIERRDSAVAAALACGAAPMLVPIDDLPTTAAERDATARLIDREAALADGVVVLWSRGGDSGPAGAAAAFVDLLRSPVVVAGGIDRARLREGQRRVETVNVPRPRGLRGGGTPPPWLPALALRAALQQFHVAPGVVEECLQSLPADSADPGAALWAALREAARGGLDALAQRIDTDIGFDDLVLPPAPLSQLREIAAQLRHRHTVYEDWGFAAKGARGLGIAALFAGESGTGKTMAAEAIANACALDLYRIDLAATVSKYIGETEKNLQRVFDAAEASGAVLLFDEADALFGKRSEVKDSHDRYANIEIAYLLQRIESYRGLAVLTTNMKSALDRAFLRRIRFVVQFPFPDEAARAELWRRQFPPAAPVQAIDPLALAAMPLAGGHVRSIALNAAFAAAASGGPITQQGLIRAARAEFAKLERATASIPGAA
jgi:hypothetical protein